MWSICAGVGREHEEGYDEHLEILINIKKNIWRVYGFISEVSKPIKDNIIIENSRR